MLRLIPLAFLLTSCGLLKVPVNVARGAANATVGATKKATSATKDFFDRDKKEKKKDAETPEDTSAPTANTNYDDLPQGDEYTPAPVRPTVFIPDRPTAPGVPQAPVPEAPAPTVPAAPPLPGDVKLPELPPLDVPE